MTCCNTSSKISRTCGLGAMRANTCPFPNGASLNSGFPTPFVRSLLRTCDRKLSAKTLNAPVSSPSKKRTLSFSVKTFHRGANCFPNCRTSNDLDWLTVIIGSAVAIWDYQLRWGYHHYPCIGPPSPDI